MIPYVALEQKYRLGEMKKENAGWVDFELAIGTRTDEENPKI